MTGRNTDLGPLMVRRQKNLGNVPLAAETSAGRATVYDREMRHADWEKVYERQQKRAREVGLWLDALELTSRTCLLDLGSGPGFGAIQAARRIGPQGRVIAVDRSEAALAFLRREVEKLNAEAEGMAPIETVVEDGEELTLSEVADAGLLTHVLHHTDAPQRLVESLFRALVPGGRAVVAEFDPQAAGEIGPPLEERIAPEQLDQWLRQAGFEVVRFLPEGREQYAFLVRRP